MAANVIDLGADLGAMDDTGAMVVGGSKAIYVLDTSPQDAEALHPIAGNFAFLVFALSIIGVGFLAVLVLAGSAAYAIGEVRGWPVGLARKPRRRVLSTAH